MNGTSGFQEVRSSISRSPHRIGSCTSHGLNSLSVFGSFFVPTASSHSPIPSLLTGVLYFCFIASNLAQAQVSPITPSGLGTQVSDPIAVGGQTQYDITGGTRPGGGANLFHSFGDFSVPTNNIANFLNDTGLPTSNILGRVTGGNISNIFGTIQTEGFPNANLFLMNPAGFLFGPNATVNVGGMVAFTSADYLKLADNARFNAIPNAAADALLTALPVASFGFLGSNPGAITVQGSQFSVTDGQSISLVGSSISIESGTPEGGTAQSTQLSAPNGKIQLASAASPGEFDAATLQPLPNGNNTSFTSFGSALLALGSNINVSGENTVSIRGGQFALSVTNAVLSTADSAGAPATISLSPGSSILSSNAGAEAGADVQLTASTIQLDGASIQSLTTGTGSGGHISITGQSNYLMNGAQIVSSTSGASDGGNITISATDSVSISGYDPTSTLSGVSTFISDINTGVPLVTSGVFSSTSGSGSGGSLRINAGTATLDNAGTIASIATGDGRGGDIALNVRNLHIQNGGLILNTAGFDFTSFEFKGNGRAGDITIVAEDSIQVSGFNPNTFAESVIWSQSNNTGDGGNITLSASNISVQNGGIVQSNGSGTGNTGSISITADQVSISGFDEIGISSQISSISPAANSGTITITVQSVNITDLGLLQTVGNGGNITIQGAQNVNVTSVSAIQSVGGDTGPSGDIAISADQVLISGQNEFSRSRIETVSGGQAETGKITLNVRELVVTDGGRINTENTVSGSRLGGIHIIATESLTVSDEGKILMENRAGPAGPIAIDAPTITLDQGIIQTESLSGNAGSVTLHADNLTLAGGFINTKVTQDVPGRGGDVTINVTDTVSLSGQFNGNVVGDNPRPAGIYADTAGTLQGGDISVTAGNLVFLSGAGAGLFSQSLGSSGDGGAISVQAPQVQLSDSAMISAKSTGSGNAGTITVEGTASPAQSVLIDGLGSGIFTDTQATGAGGNIFVDANTVTLQNGGTLSAATTGPGNAGSITINATDSVIVSGQDSFRLPPLSARSRIVTSTSDAGDGGDITITATGTISLAGNQSGVFSNTSGTGSAGNITMAADTLALNARARVQANTLPGSEGIGGNINVQVRAASLTGNSSIDTNTQGLGDAGSVRIRASESIALVNGSINSSAFDFGSGAGNGGSIWLTAPMVTLQNGRIISQSNGPGNAGNILLEADTVSVEANDIAESEIAAATGGPGRGGDITIHGFNGPSSRTSDVTISGSSTLTSQTDGDGRSGDISVKTARLTLSDGSAMTTSTGAAGDAGQIIIDANESVHVSTLSSLVSSSDVGPGHAGQISLTTPSLTVEQGGSISTSTSGTGDAGSIAVNANSVSLLSGGQLTSSSIMLDPDAPPTGSAGSVTVQGLASPAQSMLIDGPGSGISSATEGTGAGGSISVNANSVTLQNGGTLSATTSGTDTTATGGTITVDAPNTITLNSASITASSTGVAAAGSIKITGLNGFTMQNSSIATQAGQGAGGGNIKVTTAPSATVLLQNSKISASVADGSGGGGNISIDPQFVILQNSQILAQAAQGQGGAITIIANLFLPDANSIVNADSGSGVNGTITIQSPNAPVSGQIQPLNKTPLLATSLLNQHCAALAGGRFSSFTVAGRDSLPTEPGSWLASPLYASGVGVGEGQVVSGEWQGLSDVVPGGLAAYQIDQTNPVLLSLRQIAPAGFLTQAFATDWAGCKS
jgi:filamentous hemagglutinin family protein